MAEIINTDRVAALETERNGLQEQLRTASADIERLKPFEAEVSTLRARVLELEPLANDGKSYRENLIKETIAEGVRAFGADFAVETYTGLLNGVPLDVVKRMKADWQKAADTIFSGGRKTVDGVAEAPKDAPVSESDDKNSKNLTNAAYAG